MPEDNWGPAEPIRQAIHDLVSKFTIHIGTPQPSQSEHDKAVQDMNKQLNDQRVQDANKSFQKPQLSDDQAAKIRAKVKGK